MAKMNLHQSPSSKENIEGKKQLNITIPYAGKQG